MTIIYKSHFIVSVKFERSLHAHNPQIGIDFQELKLLDICMQKRAAGDNGFHLSTSNSEER